MPEFFFEGRFELSHVSRLLHQQEGLESLDHVFLAIGTANTELYIARDRLPAIDQDHTYYHSDLIGLDAMSEDGAQIGTVHAVHDFGAGAVLEITPLGSGETLMLPFTETTVPKVDLAAKQIVVVPPAEVEAREE